MKGKTLFKTILVAFLVGWALIALWPTYKLQTLSPEQQKALDAKGELMPLLEKGIRLGLDLQGGMYLTYEIDLPELFAQIAENKDPIFDEIMSNVREALNIRAEDFLTILADEFKTRDIPLHRYWGNRRDSDAKVKDFLEDQAKDAMDRAMQKLRNRIDQFGVAEPNIQKVGGRRILIELPGITDQDRAKELIGKTALLEFSLVKDARVVMETIEKIDQAVARKRKGESVEDMELLPKDSTEAVAEQKESKDKAVSVSELFGEKDVEMDMNTTEPDTALLVDEDLFEENPFIALLRNTKGRDIAVPVENIRAVKRILAQEEIHRFIPSDAVFRWSAETFSIDNKQYRELYLLKKEPALLGKHVTDARVTIGSGVTSQGKPVVNFALDPQGRRVFSRVTGANLDKRLAIILDSMVTSAPVIQSKIPDGRGQITGIPNMDEAKMTAIVLRVGALPAPLRVIEERTVGPSLGMDSVNSGKMAALIGFGIVVVFMIIYYRMAGLIANMALLLNIILLMAMLAQFGFTLTLPGIAGIVLTIGMAVDANVLVFERIREELKTGKTVRASIDSGYSQAFKTILDANITTLLTAVVLYQFGSGPIRGFAVTLAIGIIVSMFTALVVTRMIFDGMTSRRVMKKLSI
ncbi:protein translocase subunit SecD [bacterium]|nr:protein translocase subunit SecD [bacterium]RQV98214.1 MAG: protein translocase subunit SecD [bacterium]